MKKLRQFPTVRTNLGTITALGLCQNTTADNTIGFVLFEKEGRLYNYSIERPADFLYLTDVLTNRASITIQAGLAGLTRYDIGAEVQNSALYLYLITEQTFVPIPRPSLVPSPEIAYTGSGIPGADQAVVTAAEPDANPRPGDPTDRGSSS